MNHLLKRSVLVIFVLFVGIGLLSLKLPSKPVQAGLGNSGIPVRCVPDKAGQTISPGESEFFRCTAADGTLFNDNQQRVPESRYLLVTDIVITPDTIASTPGNFTLSLYAAYGKSSRAYHLEFHDISGNTVSEHYSVPFIVLPSDYRIEGVNDAASTYGLNINISGLLVTNANYLPLTTR